MKILLKNIYNGRTTDFTWIKPGMTTTVYLHVQHLHVYIQLLMQFLFIWIDTVHTVYERNASTLMTIAIY